MEKIMFFVWSNIGDQDASLKLAVDLKNNEPVNELGIREVLHFAFTVKIRPVHYISGVSVFEDDSNFDLRMVMEDGSGLVGGYVQSKWGAKKWLE